MSDLWRKWFFSAEFILLRERSGQVLLLFSLVIALCNAELCPRLSVRVAEPEDAKHGSVVYFVVRDEDHEERVVVVDEVSVLDLLELRRKAREHGGVAMPLVEPVDREGAGRADEHALRIELKARAVPEVASLRELNVLELVFGLNAVELFDAGGVEEFYSI